MPADPSRVTAVSVRRARACGRGPLRRQARALHDDLCHVRIVDAGGRTLPNGERGAVVIWNLVNCGTVLLNYHLGDLARVTTEPCPCGRTTRLLSELEGRSSEVLQLPDRSFVHPEAVYDVVTAREELIVKYHLVQVETSQELAKLKRVVALPREGGDA